MTDSILLREFTLFPALPTEIRSAIWKLATLEPRLIEIRKVLDCLDVVQYFTPTPMPSLLGVCHESREEALKAYIVMEVRPIYFGPSEDSRAAKFCRDTFQHLAIHPEPDLLSCKMCAKRAQQQAYIKYIKAHALRVQAQMQMHARAQGWLGEGISDFDYYLATLEDVHLSDISLDTNGKYEYEKYCLKRLLSVEHELEKKLINTIVPFRTFIDPFRDLVYLNPSINLMEFFQGFPQLVSGTNSQLPIQHLVVHLEDSGKPFQTIQEAEFMRVFFAIWAAESTNIKTITLVLEDQPISSIQDSNQGKVIGFDVDVMPPTPMVPYFARSGKQKS